MTTTRIDTDTDTAVAEHLARRLAEAFGATLYKPAPGVIVLDLPDGWAWKATGTRELATEDWPLMVTMMRYGAERKGADPR